MKRSTLAVCRALTALFLAVILLSVSGFGFLDLMKGPVKMTQDTDISPGDYLTADVTFLMDIVGVEKNTSGREIAYYAVAPVGDTFCLFRFGGADMENARRMEEATDAFLQGESLTMDIYLTATGTASPMNEEEGTLLLEWFDANADWMIAGGVIAETEDYSTYLTNLVIRTDHLGGLPVVAVVILSVLAAVLVAYALVEVVLAAAGVYDPERASGRKKKETGGKRNA